MIGSVFGILAVFLARAVSVGARGYVGCVNSLQLPVDVVTQPGALTQADCDTACQTTHSFNYFVAASTTCYCSDTAPTAVSLTSSLTNAGDCDINEATATRLNTGYDFLSCADAFSSVITYITSGNVADVQACFQMCASGSNAGNLVFSAFYYPAGKGPAPVPGVDSPWCACPDTSTYTPTVCGPTTQYAYNNVRAPGASIVVRRSVEQMEKNRRDLLAQKKSRGLCPYPLSACRVSEGSDGFECLNTDRELESCGGCRFGEYIPKSGTGIATITNGTAPDEGFDCTTLDGVPRKSVACINGACRAYACRRGYRLMGDKCVPR